VQGRGELMGSLGRMVKLHMGVSLNGGTPKTPQVMIILVGVYPWLLGTSILGTPHMGGPVMIFPLSN